MTRRDQLYAKLENYYLYFRGSMISSFDASTLRCQGVDSHKFDLAEETARGGIYFHPMPQERLNDFLERPDPELESLIFREEYGYPYNGDAHMIQDMINEQLRQSKEDGQDEDLWPALASTSWEPVGTSSVFEDRLHEVDSDPWRETQDPTRQTFWWLLDMFATKNGLPHRSCMACGEIMDVTGPTRHELMILTGLMGVRMTQKEYLNYEVFPVLMLSLFGSKGRIVEAHMSPEQQRLQVRHSELFDFRNVTKEWLDIFVRWFLNEPLAEPSSSCSPDLKMCEQQPETSDDAGRSLLDLASDSDTSLSYGSRTSEQEDVAQKSQAEPSSPCEPEESEQRTENSEDEDEYWVRVRSERVVTPQKPIVKPMWSPGCHSEGTSLYQNLTIPPTLC